MAKQKQSNFQEYFDKSFKLISLRPRSVKEISDYLLRKKTPTEIAARVIKELESLRLINDQEFAVWWVEQRKTFRPKGIRALKAELRGKGISPEIVDEVLKDVDEVSLASQAARKKKLDRERLIGYLGRKGFSWSTIQTVLEEMGEKE